MIAFFSGGGEKKSTGSEITQPSIQKETVSTAFKLASIEVGHTSPPSVLVEQFENLLNKLTRKCSENNEERIADYIVNGKEMIEEKGGKTTLLEFAKAMNESIPEDMAGVVSCAEVAAALVVLMTAK